MKICIAGAGDVGSYLAEKLASEGVEVAIIDRDAVKLEGLSLKHNILTLECDLGQGDCFERFGDYDLFLLLTDNDEVNIVSALRLKGLYGKENVVVRLFKPFHTPLVERLGIDFVNAVESTVRSLELLMEYPPAKAVWEIDNILVLALPVSGEHPLVGKRLRELSPIREEFLFSVVLVWRGREFLIPKGDTEIREGDTLYIAAERERARELLERLGWANPKVKNLFVLGYSRYADYWFKRLAGKGITVKFFHPEGRVCEEVVTKYPYIEAYQSLLTDSETLKAEGIERADYVWCLGEGDEKNIVVGMFAKNLGAHRVGVLLKHPQYEEFLNRSSIDAYILPKKVVAAKVYSLIKGKKVLEVVELAEGIDIYEIPYEGEEKAVKDLKLRECDFIFAVKREGGYLIPKGDTVVKEGDILLCVRRV